MSQSTLEDTSSCRNVGKSFVSEIFCVVRFKVFSFLSEGVMHPEHTPGAVPAYLPALWRDASARRAAAGGRPEPRHGQMKKASAEAEVSLRMELPIYSHLYPLQKTTSVML